MSLQFGGTPIGAMQYNGLDIAEAMYEGEIVWSASIYPVGGEVVGALSNTSTIYATHTILEDGNFTISHVVDGGAVVIASRITGPWGHKEGSAGPPSEATVTKTLHIGDVIEFRANAVGVSGPSTATWSIVKN